MNDENESSQSDFVNLVEKNGQQAQDFNPPPNKELENQATSPEPPTQPQKKSMPKRMIVFGAVAVVILSALIAGGVYAYRTLFLSPEQVLARAFQNMQNVDSYAYEGSLKVNIRENAGDSFSSVLFPTSFGIDFEGENDTGDLEGPRSRININIRSGSTSVANADFLGLGKISYIRLNSLSDLGFGNITDLFGAWIKIEPEALAESYGLEMSEVRADPLNEQEIAELKNILINNNPIVIADTLNSEDIGGQSTYHYRYEIDKEKLKNIIIEYYDFYEELVEDSTQYGLDEEYYSELFDSITVLGGEIWIGRNDLLLKRNELTIRIEDDQSRNTSVTISFDIELNSYNQPIEINEPEESITIEDALEIILGNQFEQARDTQRRSDLLQVTNAVYQYAAEHDGNLPGGANFPTTETCIGISDECFDLGSAGGEDSIVPVYISVIPEDPSIGTIEDTGYNIFVNASGRVEASATGEIQEEIKVIR